MNFKRIEYLFNKWSNILNTKNDNIENIEIVESCIHYANFFDGTVIKEPDNNLYNSEPTFLFQTNSHVFRMDLKAVKQLHKQIGDIIS